MLYTVSAARLRRRAFLQESCEFDLTSRRGLSSPFARVTKTVLAKIKSIGGKITSSSERYNDIHAHVPLEKLEELAALKDVNAIMPAEEATTNSTPQ